jgi:C_GCAxxG_C_C family probable redox protein
MKDINVAQRKEKAVALFNEGYNCAQSVFLAYSDVYGLEDDLAKKLSASFGGGMGRMREVCGACSGMFMILGLEYPATDPDDKAAKTANYDAVQRTALAFKERFSTIICADLLKIKHQPENPTPSDRTAEYYAKRPCARFVAGAAEILGNELKQPRTENSAF